MKKISLKLNSGEEFLVTVLAERYEDGVLALSCFDHEGPFCHLSTHPKGIDVPEGYTLIKNYSENAGFLDQLVEQGIIESPTCHISWEYISLPVCKVLID